MFELFLIFVTFPAEVHCTDRLLAACTARPLRNGAQTHPTATLRQRAMSAECLIQRRSHFRVSQIFAQGVDPLSIQHVTVMRPVQDSLESAQPHA